MNLKQTTNQQVLQTSRGEFHQFNVDQPARRWLAPAFEEGDVDRRRVEVNELEDENFQDEHVFIFSLSAMHL